MEAIQLLEPAHKSSTETLQAFQWPQKPESTPGSSDATGSTSRWDALEVISGDRSMPRPVRFGWSRIATGHEQPVYDLLVSTDSAFEDPHVFRDITQPCHRVVNLHIGTRYFWKVSARDSASTLAVSPVWEFTTHSSTPRWLHVPGITNVRDLGGWSLSGNRRIRQGMVLRSSEMHGHVDITSARSEIRSSRARRPDTTSSRGATPSKESFTADRRISTARSPSSIWRSSSSLPTFHPSMRSRSANPGGANDTLDLRQRPAAETG